MNEKFTPGGTAPKPWQQMTFQERMKVYQDEALRRYDIDFYQFHGMDPRSPQAHGEQI